MTAKAVVDMVPAAGLCDMFTSTSVVADGGGVVLSLADEKWQ
ncbi:hypothetical protein [Streptomyces sp. S3(2020)]|nr:hypothetical protein [Streptomyces sp. S3(2020)]